MEYKDVINILHVTPKCDQISVTECANYESCIYCPVFVDKDEKGDSKDD